MVSIVYCRKSESPHAMRLSRYAMTVFSMYAVGRCLATANGWKGYFFQSLMLSAVWSASLGSCGRERLMRICSIILTSVDWNGFTFQKRSGVGPPLLSVGLKM